MSTVKSGFSPLKRGDWSVLHLQLLEANRAKYLDALADDEVAALTCNMKVSLVVVSHLHVNFARVYCVLALKLFVKNIVPLYRNIRF